MENKDNKNKDSIKTIATELVDIFDNFLIQKEIIIPCDDPDESKERAISDAKGLGLYGMEYYSIVDKVEELLNNRLSNENNKETQNKETSTNFILSWDECFMNLAKIIAKRSKDPFAQVGACIVDPTDNRIISLGYNGFSSDINYLQNILSKDILQNNQNTIHAELNAILSAHCNLYGCKIYITHYPCNECMKAIIKAGIKEIIYDIPYEEESEIYKSSEEMAKYAEIEITKFKSFMDTHIEVLDSNDCMNPDKEYILKVWWKDYQKFVNFMLDRLISENGYIIDCGSTLDVMRVVMELFDQKIKEHPFLWKKFFMIA